MDDEEGMILEEFSVLHIKVPSNNTLGNIYWTNFKER